MNDLEVIENKYLKVVISLNGGCLTSIIDKNKNEELLYQPDKRSWSGQDVVIFPFVAALEDRTYTVEGRTYSMKNHGIARYNRFNTVSNNGTKLIINLVSNKDIQKEYPYLFDLKVSYELFENKLSINYLVNNIDSKPIYFSVGGHPALKVDGFEDNNGFVIENTKVEFEKEYKVDRYYLNAEGNLIERIGKYKIEKEMDITKDKIVEAKTIIIDSRDMNEVVLHTNGRKYRFDISKSEILALWTMEGYGDYFCVEPWWGIPDMVNAKKELSEKPLIHKLDAKSIFETGYSITFE